jgi:sulfatase maturation enzyme AslB (radical SAM superfamily)
MLRPILETYLTTVGIDMNLDRLLPIVTAITPQELQAQHDRIQKEIQLLGLPAAYEVKMMDIITRIIHMTNNPKTRTSYIQSFIRIFQKGIDKDGRGSSIIIEITKKCTKHCTHCYSKFSSHLQEMPDAILHQIITFARSHFKHIFLTGGEPTIDPRVFTLAADNPDIMFFIFTNGSMITDAYASRLSTLGNVIPLIGIDGDNPETHDAFRGVGSYQEVQQAIDNLNAHTVSWGFIALVAETNADQVLSDAFLQDKIDKGAIIARYLEYLPIGPHPLLDCILSGETYYRLEKRKADTVKSGKIYMQEISQDKCRGLLFFTVDGMIKNCFCFHYAKYSTTGISLSEAVDQTRNEWISYTWEGECPIYADPIGFKNHLETLGWKNTSTVNEPYLIDTKIADILQGNYRVFLQLKAERGL